MVDSTRWEHSTEKRDLHMFLSWSEVQSGHIGRLSGEIWHTSGDGVQTVDGRNIMMEKLEGDEKNLEKNPLTHRELVQVEQDW